MENNNEIWKPVKDYEGFYEVSNLGRIRSLYTGCRSGIIKSFIRSGYVYVCFYKKDRNPKSAAVHRVVATSFLLNPENKACVNHKDFNKLNNTLENLEWATHSENSMHAYVNKKLNPPSISGFDNHATKPVLCLLTGRTVTSKEASDFLSISRGMLSQMLLGRYKNWTNYVYL